MSKKTLDQEIDELFDILPSDEEIKKETTSLKISNNNRNSWKKELIKQKRSQGIKNAHQENGSLTEKEKFQCYLESFGKDRNNNLYKILSKKYNIGIDYVYHIASNYFNIVSNEEHIKNLKEWNEKYGFFGHWKLTSPGQNLLKDYDKHWRNNKIPPSIIFHIRFTMNNCSPKEIRNYLLPWTDNKYLTHPDGRIANGRYIGFRKKQYPFLTEDIGKVFEFTSMDQLYEFLKKYYGNSLTRIHAHQILQGSKIKEKGPMSGWKFEKIK